jgi:hypothetical protein
MGTKRTKEDINEQLRLADRQIQLIGEYLGHQKKTLFKHLVCGNEWLTTSNIILSGKGCPNCHWQAITKDKVNDRISHREIEMIGEYTTTHEKSLFRHLVCGNEWLALPSNILRGVGCPSCADFGFNPSKPGTLYVFKRDDYIKYGITNNLNRRLSEHKRHGELKVVFTKSDNDGNIILRTEQKIKNTFGGNFVDKTKCPKGFTETLSADKLNELLLLIQ